MFQVKKTRFMVWFWMLLIIMLLQIVALYIASEKQKNDFHNNLVETELERSATELNNYFETAKSAAVSLSLDKEVITAFSKPFLNPMEQQALSIKLKQYKRMNACIEEIYLYNPDSGIVYSGTGIYTEPEEFPFPNTREYIRRLPEMKQKYAVFADSASEIGQDENVIRNSWRVKEKSNDIIFIDLNYDMFKSILDLCTENLSGGVYMLDEGGALLCKDSGTDAFLQTLDGAETDAEKLSKARGDKGMLVKKHVLKQAGAELYYTIPTAEVKTGNMQTGTLAIINAVMISVILLLAGTVSLFRSLHDIAKKNAELANRKNERERFAEKRRPVINCLTYTEKSDIEAAKAYIQTTLEHAKFDDVALLRLDLHNYSEERFADKMKLIQQFEHILGEMLPALSVYEQDEFVVFLLAGGGIDYIDRCRRAYAVCREAALAQMGVELSGYISSALDISHLDEIYTELCSVAEYKFIYNRPIFLDYTILWKRKDQREQWNRFKIEMICNNIISPRQDVDSLMDEFINDLRCLSVEKVKNALYDLFIEVYKAISVIQKEENLKLSVDISKYLQELSSLQYLDGAHNLFERMINDVERERTANVDDRHEVVVKQAFHIIREKILDPNLCRSMIADEIGISNSYLSRIFKDKVGVSLSDMINETKLKIAAEQLRNTNKSIKEIIEGVGIVNQSYFTVMFKKKFGILPTEYRNRRQEKTETSAKNDDQKE